MQQVDFAARVLACVAVLISLASLWLSWRNYRRSGARIVVTGEKQLRYETMFFEGPICEDVLAVRVTNKGLAKIQIANMFYEVYGKLGFVTLDPNGPQLPFVLEGMHQELWTPSLSTVARGAELQPDGPPVRVRAGVVLGDGRQAKSKWLTLAADELTKP